jgi:hypothetical protein
VGQLIKLNNKPNNFEYSTTFQTKNNKTLYAKIIIDFKNFPPSIRTPFVNLMIKWGKLYPNDCFQRLRRYLKSIQVPYVTKYPLTNGWGHLYVFFPYISEEKSVCYVNQHGIEQELDSSMDDLKIFYGTFADKNKVIPLIKQLDLKL